MAKKCIPIELDRIRNLRYGMQAMINLERKLGKPMASIDFEKEVRYEEIATIIWAGLYWEDKTLTVDAVVELIDEHSDIQTAFKVMGEAMSESFGKNEQMDRLEEIKAEARAKFGIGTQPSETQLPVE
jgi:hypothetical protein